MKKIITLSVMLILSYAANAQSINTYSYKTALGVKVLDGAGITFKSFVNGNNAIELVGFFWRQGFRITGLYEIHGNIAGARGLKWYVGPGAHIGFYNKDYYAGATSAGIDGVLGLDYKINGAPINFSLDWQPSFEFANNRGFVGSWGGFAVRYTF